MSKFIQSHYEEAVLELRSIPFDYTNEYSDQNNRSGYWASTPRIRFDKKHYDIINSLHHFFLYQEYTWDYDDFFQHIKKVAFEKNWRNEFTYQLFDFAHSSEKDRRNRWYKPLYWYRHKRSYQRKPEHQKKGKHEPRWSDTKKPWKKEKHRSGWKQHAKKTTTRSNRIEAGKRMHQEDYDRLPSNYKKYHWYDY